MGGGGGGEVGSCDRVAGLQAELTDLTPEARAELEAVMAVMCAEDAGARLGAQERFPLSADMMPRGRPPSPEWPVVHVEDEVSSQSATDSPEKATGVTEVEGSCARTAPAVTAH